MARNRESDILFSAAVRDDERTGPFVRYLRAGGKSENTIADYQVAFAHFLRIAGDAHLRAYDCAAIEAFLATMAADTTAPAGVAQRVGRRRSPKTLRNYHTALSSLWTWAIARHFADEHIVREVPGPRTFPAPVNPLQLAEVDRLIRAAAETAAWSTHPFTTTRRPTAERDQALIMLLCQTGLRIGEAVALLIGDLTLSKGDEQVRVRHGKGGKDRFIPLQGRTVHLLHRWLDLRPDAGSCDYVFVTWLGGEGRALERRVAGKIVRRIGERAGIERNVTPHLLRTTAACLMAAGGMSVWELKQIMGHSRVETTMRYVRAANLDLRSAMRRSSPFS